MKNPELSPQVERAARPVCSRCGKPVPAVVSFLACSTEHGRAKGGRGTSRRIRLCGGCLKLLSHALRFGS